MASQSPHDNPKPGCFKGSILAVYNFFRNCWPDLLTWLSAAVLAYASIWAAVYPETAAKNPHKVLAFAVLSIVLALGGLVGNYRRGRQISSLETQISELHGTIERKDAQLQELTRKNLALDARGAKLATVAYDVISYQLAGFARNFGFAQTERISLFRFDRNTFVLAGRYAYQPAYDVKNGDVYTISHGCLGIAWTQGQCYEKDLPDFSKEAAAYVDQVQTRLGLQENEIRNLAMKGRTFFGKTIPDFTNKHPLAVLMIESTKPSFSSLEILTNKTEEIERQIAELLDFVEEFESSPTETEARGF